MKPTSTLVRLHIQQGYLGRARGMLDTLSRDPGAPVAELEALWGKAADRARRQAAVDTLRRLLAQVRRRSGRTGS